MQFFVKIVLNILTYCLGQYNPQCTCSFDLHIILHSQFSYSAPFDLPFYIRGSKRDINNYFFLFQMNLSCGQLKIDLLEVNIVVNIMFRIF
jgi:hypothetical protein